MIFAFIVAAVLLLACLYAYRVAFYSPKSKRAKVDDPLNGAQYEAVVDNISRISGVMQKFTYEPISIESFDGTRLFGRYYHLRDDAPLEILFHGYRSHPFRDCSGGHALARKMGFNTLVVDQRAHGKSDGVTITFGNKERRDCLRWVKYCTERFGSNTPIILSGLSMGAATVLMASDLELPENVACILADSPYSTPSAIIEKVCADLHYPVAICRPFIHLSAMLLGRFRLNGCTAKDSVSRAKVPILLIHGEDDRFVPCSMSREIADCCVSRVEVHTFPDAGHGLCYMTDPLRYEKIVHDFLQTVPSLAQAISPDFLRQHDR